MAGTHKNQTDNHRPHTWEFANAASRAAFTGYTAPTVNDVGKWARQLDNDTFWMLSDDSPVTWVSIAGATVASLTAHAAIDSDQTTHGHTSWEMIQDMLVAALLEGTGITITYDDTANTFTFDAAATLEALTTSLADGSIPVAESGVLIDNPDLEYDATNRRIRVGAVDPSAGGTLSIGHVNGVDGGNSGLDISNDYTNPTQPTSQYGSWNQVTGVNDTNVAGYFRAANGTKNHALITDGGLVGFGVGNPSEQLEMAGNLKLASGNVMVAGGATVDGIDVSVLAADVATHEGTDGTQTVKGHLSFEMIQDMLLAALVASTGITITYDDTANTFSIKAIAPRTLGWFFESSFAIGNQQGPTYTVDADGTITGFDAYAATAPTGSAADFDIKKSTNGGSTWATVFSTRPTIAAAAHVATGAVVSVASVSVGDLIRLDIIAVGSTTAAVGVTAQLKLVTR